MSKDKKYKRPHDYSDQVDACHTMSLEDCTVCTTPFGKQTYDVEGTLQCDAICSSKGREGQLCSRPSMDAKNIGKYCLQHQYIHMLNASAEKQMSQRQLEAFLRYVERSTSISYDQKRVRVQAIRQRIRYATRNTIDTVIYTMGEMHIDPFTMINLRMAQKNISRYSNESLTIPIILKAFGYTEKKLRSDPSIMFQDDRDLPLNHPNAGAATTIIIICHNLQRTMEMIHDQGWSAVIIVGTTSDELKTKTDRFTKESQQKLNSITFLLPWVQKVGSDWLKGYPNLKHVSFKGMSSLTNVGDYWMADCTSLQNPDFMGLSNLTHVGNGWMGRCHKVENPNFVGLSGLTHVGNGWMNSCHKLENPNFMGLSNLRSVGDHWMAFCTGLKSPDFQGLHHLYSVGKSWMWSCWNLYDPNFTGLSNTLMQVGKAWMQHSSGYLKDRTFKSMNNHIWTYFEGDIDEEDDEGYIWRNPVPN